MSFPSLRRTLGLCATAGLLGHCERSAPEGTQAQGSLATVAGQAITEQDLLKEAEWRRANHQAVPAATELLKELVNRLALAEKARQTGLADDPETKRRIQSLLVGRLREKELDADLAKIEVTPEEIAKAYEARREEFSHEGLDRFAILFQAADAKMSEARRAESRGRLEAAIVQSDANPAAGGRGPAATGFGEVAAQNSEDQSSRYRGGDIGWIPSDAKETRWPATVLEAGRALEKGKRSGVLEGTEGFYVIMKTDSRPGGTRPLGEVSEGLRQGLLHDKRRALEERFVDQALQLSKVEINTEAAAKVILPTAPTPTPTPDSEISPN